MRSTHDHEDRVRYWLTDAVGSGLHSGLHLVTYLHVDVSNFCDKSTETTLQEICVQVFLRFSDSSKPIQSVSLLYLLESVNLRKTCSKLHVRLLLWSKLPIYFDDVRTMENNRQVRVNIDATLVTIFCIIIRLNPGVGNCPVITYAHLSQVDRVA